MTVGQAIRAGDVDELKRLLTATPGLALARIVDTGGVARTLLHVVTDWPGHFPNGAATVEVLANAGADVNARAVTPDATKPAETPLHWAASSDDVAVLDALLDKGADIEASGRASLAAPPWTMRWRSGNGTRPGGWWRGAREPHCGIRRPSACWKTSRQNVSGHTTEARHPWGRAPAPLRTRSPWPSGARATADNGRPRSIFSTKAPS